MPSGGEATIREVVALMLETGDNSAANVLMRLLGGAARVRASLASMEITGISIDRDETAMALDSYGLRHPPIADRTPAKLMAMTKDVSPERHRAALKSFMTDQRDHASPFVMGRLISEIWRGRILDSSYLNFLRRELARNKRGPNRIRAGVPKGVPVADRTGGCYGMDDDDAPCANDVGVITLPSGDHVAIAIFVEDSGGPIVEKEKLIASITRAVWDYFERMN